MMLDPPLGPYPRFQHSLELVARSLDRSCLLSKGGVRKLPPILDMKNDFDGNDRVFDGGLLGAEGGRRIKIELTTPSIYPATSFRKIEIKQISRWLGIDIEREWKGG